MSSHWPRIRELGIALQVRPFEEKVLTVDSGRERLKNNWGLACKNECREGM